MSAGATAPGTIHTGLAGPILSTEQRGHKYYLNLFDEYSRHTVRVPVRSTGDVFGKTLIFLLYFER